MKKKKQKGELNAEAIDPNARNLGGKGWDGGGEEEGGPSRDRAHEEERRGGSGMATPMTNPTTRSFPKVKNTRLPCRKKNAFIKS